ncbi:MAG: PAS domain S-box protein [Promethearchaeota archaeon]|nr:MAG: PAS domain S-box protein [Candidatus Lokiarchaeota archaeon]
MVNIIEESLNFPSMDLFKLAAENINDLIAIINDEFKFEFINSRAHHNSLGYDKSDLIGKSAKEFIHPKDRKKTAKSFKNVFELREQEGNLRLRGKDGKYIWVFMKAIRFVENSDKVKVLIIAREIKTPRNIITKKSEERFKEICDNLTEIRFWKFLQPKEAIVAYQESQEMLKLITDSIPQYIAWKDKDLLYMGCNNNFLTLVRVNDPKYIIGKTDFEIGLDEEIAISSRLSDTRVLESNRAEYHQIESWNKSGDDIWFDINRIPLHDLEGNVVGILVTLEDITYRITAERTLQKSEKRFRTLIEKMNEGLCILDEYNIITYVNDRLLEMLRLDRDAMMNHQISGFVGSNYVDSLETKLQNRKKESQSFELVWIDKNDNPVYTMFSPQPVFSPEGNFKGSFAVITNITELKKATEKLKESEEKYRDLAELLPVIIYEADLNLNLTYVNPIGFKKFGYTQEDFENGINIIQLVAPDQREEGKRNIINVLKGVETKPHEYVMKKKEGSNFYASVHSRPIYKNGSIIGLRGVVHDITERYLAEKKLKESEEKYRHLFNSSPYAIWLVNLEGIIIDCNITMNNFLSIYTKDDLIGKNFREVMKLFSLKGDQRFENLKDIFNKRFNLLIENEKLEPFEFQITRGDGKLFWITIESSFVSVGNERLIQVLIKDITERKQAELKILESEEKLKKLNKELEIKVMERTKELMQKNIELKKLDELKDEFITAAAHELKTPLISISGYTDYILMKYKEILNSEMTQDLLIVQRNIDRLHKLMNQLLDVMKIDSQKMELDLKQTNASELIHNCVDELSYLIKEKNHEISLNLEDDVYIQMDPERIFQVLSNLLSNAIKFTPPNGKIEISLLKDKPARNYIFKFKDNGIGLNNNEIERLFKKFEMVKQVNEEEYNKGTGLGLYISRGFIEAHGGKIWAISEGLNKGTTLFFSLPM